MKKRVGKTGTFLCACMFALICFMNPQNAYASERTGSLTIYYHGVTPQGNQTVLSGAGFSLYKVGGESRKRLGIAGCV